MRVSFLPDGHIVKREGFWLACSPPAGEDAITGDTDKYLGPQDLKELGDDSLPAEGYVGFSLGARSARYCIIAGGFSFFFFFSYSVFAYNNHDLSWASIIPISLTAPECTLWMPCESCGMFLMWTHTCACAHKHTHWFVCFLFFFSSSFAVCSLSRVLEQVNLCSSHLPLCSWLPAEYHMSSPINGQKPTRVSCFKSSLLCIGRPFLLRCVRNLHTDHLLYWLVKN